jgi:hypothetical protein
MAESEQEDKFYLPFCYYLQHLYGLSASNNSADVKTLNGLKTLCLIVIF